MHKYLQQEWEFLQCSTQGLGYDFRPVEKDPYDKLLLALFLGTETHMLVQKIMGLPVKHARMEITKPTHTEKDNWTT